MKINPQFLFDEKGNKIGVFLTQQDFETMLDEIEDLRDSIKLKNLIEEERGKPLYTEEDVFKALELTEEEIQQIKSGTVENPFENEEGEKNIEPQLDNAESVSV